MGSRGSWTAAIAAAVLLLSGCALGIPVPSSPNVSAPAQDPAPPTASSIPSPTPTEEDPPASEAPQAANPSALPGQALQDPVNGRVFVTANSNTWNVDLNEAGQADIEQLVMYDSGAPAEPPSARDSILWVCFDATQTSGFPGSWVGDDLRFEIVGQNGVRYDHFTAIDYAMADESQDFYFAQGNDLDETYVNICALFLVPREVDATTVAVVPDNGVPLELDLN